MHDGVKEHCDQCEHKAYDKPSLSKHVIAVHMKITPYPCDACDYKGATSGNLRMHALTHVTRMKDLVCSECNYKTS